MKIDSPLIFIGFAINCLITVMISSSDRYQGLVYICIGALAINIIGYIFMLAKKIKLGGILFIIGCVPFVPIGIVGIMGVKKIMNEEKEQKFIEKEYGGN